MLNRCVLVAGLSLAVMLAGCSSGPGAKVNSVKKFKAKCELKWARNRQNLVLSVNGDKFRIHHDFMTGSQNGQKERYEFDTLYDGKSLWRINGKVTPVVPPGPAEELSIEKKDGDPGDLAQLVFWRISGGDWESKGVETVEGETCTKLLKRKMGMAVSFNYVWVDDSRSVVRKFTEGGSFNGKGTDFVERSSVVVREIDLAPSFSDDEFRFDPGSKKVTEMERIPYALFQVL